MVQDLSGWGKGGAGPLGISLVLGWWEIGIRLVCKAPPLVDRSEGIYVYIYIYIFSIYIYIYMCEWGRLPPPPQALNDIQGLWDCLKTFIERSQL